MIEWLTRIEPITGGLILTAVLATLAIYGVFRLSGKYQQLKHQLSQAQNDIRAINSGALGMGRRIRKFANDIANVEISQIVEDTSHTPEKTYQQAGLLLDRGATIEEVVDACEMSPAEVELLAILRHSGAAA